MKKMNIKKLLIKGVLPFTTALTMSSFSAMSAQAASSKVVEDSFIEEESAVSEELESISADVDSLSDFEVAESIARNCFLDIVFETDKAVDNSKLNDALTTFQPKNQKIKDIAPQVLRCIIAADGSVDDNHALSITWTFSKSFFSSLLICIKDDYVERSNCYFDENKEVSSHSSLSYHAVDGEMDHYDLDCYDQKGMYSILYYPGLEKCFIYTNIGDHTDRYEKNVPSENMEEFFDQLNSLFILASTTSFETNSYLSTPEVDNSFGKTYQLTNLNHFVKNTDSKESK